MKLTHLILVIFLFSAPIAVVDAKERISPMVSGALTAEFQHQGYRTIISDSSPFLLAQGADEVGGLFVLGSAGESGIVSWEAGGQNPHRIGPLVISLAAEVSEADFNAWTANGQKSGVDPWLYIPVSSLAADSVSDGQGIRQTWVNSQAETARVFVRGCSNGPFRRYGDLHFEKEAITFMTWTDEQGDPHVEVTTNQASLALDEGTWASLLATCDLKGLPEAPTGGIATDFWGTTVRVPHVQGTFPGLVDEIVIKLRSLTFNRTLEQKEIKELVQDLNKASVAALQAGKAEKAFKALSRFRNSVEQLAQEGVLDLPDSESLISGADAIESFVDLLVSKLTAFPNPDYFCPGPVDPSCPVREPCQATVFHVQSDLDLPNPDGTRDNPFPTIAKALQQAAKQMSCGVEIIVGEGIYIGDLGITLDTRITGPVANPPDAMIIGGSIINNGPFTVQIENGTIAAEADGILSDHPCARTITSNVQVIGARGYGIHHRGGALLASDTTVAATMSLPSFLSTGTGILMTCGARGVFSGMALANNQSSGLLLSGAGTSVSALDLSVTGTRVHPEFANPAIGNPWGGIHVREEAELFVHGFWIRNNLFYGVRVETDGYAYLTGSASTIRTTDSPGVVCGSDFRDPRDPTGTTMCVANEVLEGGFTHTLEIINGTISSTRNIGDIFSSRAESGGGINAAASGGGSLRLTNFASTRADLAGLLVARNGELDLNTGIVSDCPVGARVLVPGYDLSRLESRVRYEDNGVALDTEGGPPVPSPAFP